MIVVHPEPQQEAGLVSLTLLAAWSHISMHETCCSHNEDQ